jgi:hypothetical protein
MRVGQIRSDPRSLARSNIQILGWRYVENSIVPLFRTGLIPLTIHSIPDGEAFS